MWNGDEADRSDRGRKAEELGAAFLALNGYELIERNVRLAGGEIDLVLRRGGWLVLCEVRLRSHSGFGHPAETIHGRKLRALQRTGRAYVARNRGGADCWRFDILTVRFPSPNEAHIEHFPGAVPLEGGGRPGVDPSARWG